MRIISDEIHLFFLPRGIFATAYKNNDVMLSILMWCCANFIAIMYHTEPMNWTTYILLRNYGRLMYRSISRHTTSQKAKISFDSSNIWLNWRSFSFESLRIIMIQIVSNIRKWNIEKCYRSWPFLLLCRRHHPHICNATMTNVKKRKNEEKKSMFHSCKFCFQDLFKH